jgi:phosphoribosylanthranilate isomerase
VIQRPRVKFCGMTRREDAVVAADLGADAIGFVFWEGSPRAIAPQAARDIARALPPLLWRVGVFVDATVAEIRDVAEAVGLDVVQLHGDESPDTAQALGGRIVKALGRREHDLIAAAAPWPHDVLLLVDAIDPVRRGGTGELADWDGARALAARRRVVLAGGLVAENVGDAIRAVRPYGVDVSSGIEASPGVKDRRRMQAFMDAVARAGKADQANGRLD